MAESRGTRRHAVAEELGCVARGNSLVGESKVLFRLVQLDQRRYGRRDPVTRELHEANIVALNRVPCIATALLRLAGFIENMGDPSASMGNVPLYLGCTMALMTGDEAIPGPLVHVAPMTAVGRFFVVSL